MATWTSTLVASNVTGESVQLLGADYDAVDIEVVTAPVWEGYQGVGVVTRKLFYNLGLVVCTVQPTTFAPKVLRYNHQLFVPDFGKVNRAFLYLHPGVVVNVYGANYS